MPSSPEPAAPSPAAPSPAAPSIETLAVLAGRSDDGNALAPILWPTSTWSSSGLDDTRRRATRLRPERFYSRYGNPTVKAFEEAIAALEGAEAALAFGSGMGAVASTILALCSNGSHIVAQRQLYAGTQAFLEGPCRRFGMSVTYVDATVPGAFASAVEPGRTIVVLAETPSNPRLELADLDEVGAITGPFTIVDSTFATPLGQRPLEHGVDIVLHSATKGIAGHNDATLGVIAAEKDVIDAIWGYSTLHGSTPSPFDALNGLRGIRTLAVRVARQSESASLLASALGALPGVSAVHHPSLESYPQRDLAERQMRHPGTVLAIELGGGEAAVGDLLDRLHYARVATSLGGPETLVCHPATSTHASLSEEEQAAIGVTPGLVRVSVGLEHPEDLVVDFTQALASRPAGA